MTDDIRAWASADLSDANLVAAIERCVEARANLLKNANPQLTMESAMVELVRLVPGPALDTAGW
jgi:hypothetical protein